MLAVVSLIAIVVLSLIVTRVATVALSLTGLSRESARFQARSALSGAGFTTSESEAVVTHPVRRRIVMMLILLGNAGIVSGVATLLLTFTGADTGTAAIRIGIIGLSLVALWLAVRSPIIDRWLQGVIERALRRYTDLDARDYASLLHLAGDWQVVELVVQPEDWMAEHTLAELDLRHEGVVVLGITRRDGEYVGAPGGPTRLHAGDTLLVYGRKGTVADLDNRRSGRLGDRAHERAARRHEQERATQEDD